MKPSELTTKFNDCLEASSADEGSIEQYKQIDAVLIANHDAVEAFLTMTQEEIQALPEEEAIELAYILTCVSIIEERNAALKWREPRKGRDTKVTYEEFSKFENAFIAHQNNTATPHVMEEFFNSNAQLLSDLKDFYTLQHLAQFDKQVYPKVKDMMQLRKLASVFAQLMPKA